MLLITLLGDILALECFVVLSDLKRNFLYFWDIHSSQIGSAQALESTCIFALTYTHTHPKFLVFSKLIRSAWAVTLTYTSSSNPTIQSSCPLILSPECLLNPSTSFYPCCHNTISESLQQPFYPFSFPFKFSPERPILHEKG